MQEYTQMSLPIEVQEGVTTLLPEASPVKTCLLPTKKDRVLKAIARLCSMKLGESFMRYDRKDSAWRMYRGYILGWEKCSPTLPKAGYMTSNGSVYELTNLEELIGDDECLFLGNLPTPRASLGEHPGIKSHKKKQTKHLSMALYEMTGQNGVTNPDFVEGMMGFPQGWTDI